MNSSVAERPSSTHHPSVASESFGSGIRYSAARRAVNEVAPNSYTRSDRWPATICTHSLRLHPIQFLIGGFGFGFHESVRLRIFSVPCGGSSWRRARLPKDDGVATIGSSASRAERTWGNVAPPRRHSYAPARRPGLLQTMVVVSRKYPTRSPAERPIQTGRGSSIRRRERSRS